MSSAGYHRSRIFKVSASVLLSTAYFVTAIGVWLVQQGQISTTADVTSATCVAPFQDSIDFQGVQGNGILHADAVLTPALGWTVTNAGATSISNIRPPTQPAYNMAMMSGSDPVTIARSIRATSTGILNFYTSVSTGQVVLTLFSNQGEVVRLRGTPETLTPGLSAIHWERYNSTSDTYELFNPSGNGVVPLYPGATVVSWTPQGIYGTNFAFPEIITVTPYTNPDTVGPISRFTIGYAGSTTMELGVMGWPAGTRTPCVTSVAPAQPIAGAAATLTGINFTGTDNTVALTANGVTTSVDHLPGGTDGTQLSFTVPATLATGSYSLTVTNVNGQSPTFGFTVAPSGGGGGGGSGGQPPGTPIAGSGLVCAATESAKTSTDDFETYADGATAFGLWSVSAGANTSATIRRGSGNPTTALELAGSGQGNQVRVGHDTKATANGSLSFDLKPAQTTSRLILDVMSPTNRLIELWFEGNGKLKYSSNVNPSSTGGTGLAWGVEDVGPNATYQANQWQTVKLDWNGSTKTFDVFLNGSRLNSAPLPYATNVTSPGDATRFEFSDSDGSPTGAQPGAFLIDNVSYPSCGANLALSVNPTSGTAPLVTTATVTLPATNLMNEPSTEVSDVGAAAGTAMTRRRTSAGAIEVTAAPQAASCTATAWLSDLDQATSNQLVWKRTIPDQSVVESRLSFETTASGTLLGLLGLIDDSGHFHAAVGFQDSAASGSTQFGSLIALSRDYQTKSVSCSPDTFTDTVRLGTPAGTGSGSALLKIVRSGSHVKLFVDGQLLQEHAVTGSIAGIGFAAAALPGTDFGTVRLESLNLTDSNVRWSFGDGFTAQCIGGSNGQRCTDTQTTGETGTTVRHTYQSAGTYQLAATNSGQTASRSISVAAASGSGDGSTTSGDSSGTTKSGSSAENATSGESSSSSATASGKKLVASGGSLAVNLALATLLSVTTTVWLLRRRADR